tara:strand:+ start:282 stop:1415 length:1134 start_codon:yes stop_codon:yes gene_type:complete
MATHELKWSMGNDLSRRFNSFTGMQEMYEQTKPIHERGGLGKSRNIRPIFQRSNKIHKIRKIDENTYVLLDGGLGDPNGWHGTKAESKIPELDFTKEMIDDMVFFAPIVWRYDPERNVESVGIRYHSVEHYVSWRTSFLRFCVPDPLRVSESRQGKLYVDVGVATDDYPNVVHKKPFESIYIPRPKAEPRGFSTGDFPTRDSMTLVFERTRTSGSSPTQREYDALKYVSGGGTEIATRKRTDIERKKKYQDAIENYWQYLVTYAPFVSDDWKVCREYVTDLAEYIKGERDAYGYYDSSLHIYNQEKATDVVTNTSNEHRLALLYFFMERNSLLRRVKNMAYDADKKQAQKIRSQFNRFMNEWLGLNYLVEEVVGQPK